MAELTVRRFIASVWLLFGLGAKVLGLVPRHRKIVAGVLGDGLAGPATVAVGLGETALGLWVLSARRPRLAATVQTAAIAVMNGLELRRARRLLLAPRSMIVANVGFLALVWVHALRLARRQEPAS